MSDPAGDAADPDAPLSYAELQKLDDGTYISEVRKNQANVIARTRDSADKAWKIAAGVAAVIVATGFTDRLQSTAPWVRAVGAAAVLAWLITTGLFIWVNVVPGTDAPIWKRHKAAIEAKMEAEKARAAGDRVREREVYARIRVRIMQEVVRQRFRQAVTSSFVALALTAAALAAVIFTGSQASTRTGFLLLTDDGKAALVEACPKLTAATVAHVLASVDTENIGVDKPIKITFGRGACDSSAMVVYLDGELLRGLSN